MEERSKHFQTKRISTKQLDLEMAKEILAELFHTRYRNVDDMIRRRLHWLLYRVLMPREQCIFVPGCLHSGD